MQTDILRDKHGIEYRVKYLSGGFIKTNGLCNVNLLDSNGYLEIEVIGNIHDNNQ